MTDILNPDALQTSLNQLDGWSGTTDSGLSKTYTFHDFAGSMRFVNRVAEIAEQRNHHPDIAISWNRVALTIISHSAGGVTEDCVELARAIDGRG